MTLLCSGIYLFITYLMTNQPIDRIVPFVFIGFLTSFTAQGFGLFASSLFDLKGTLTFGAVFLPLLGIFSGTFIQMKKTHWMFHWIFSITFMKHALDAGTTAIFGWNREKMNCDESENYCHYARPKKFVDSIELHEDFSDSVQNLFYFLFLFRLVAFGIMRYRLKNS